MAGMKSGSGDDPFADADDQEDKTDADVVDDRDDDRDPEPLDESVTESSDDIDQPAVVDRSSHEALAEDVTPDLSDRVPFKYARKNAQSEREMVQFFLMDSTSALEDDLVDDVESFLDEDALLTDVREAAYLVAMAHADEVADVLRVWGYE